MIELVCLGSGFGYSHVYDGSCSTAFVVVVHSRPALLVGCGGGVVHECLRLFGELPEAVFLHNNRYASAAELPVMLAMEASKQRLITVYGSVPVMQRLLAYRLAELHEQMRSAGQTVDDLCEAVPLEEGSPAVPLNGDGGRLGLAIAVRRSPQAERSDALLLLRNGQPLLALSGDAGCNASFYSDLCFAPFAVLDARAPGMSSSEHAGFDEVVAALSSPRVRKGAKIFAAQHGGRAAASAAKAEGLALLGPGDVVSLVADAVDDEAASGWSGSSPDPRVPDRAVAQATNEPNANEHEQQSGVLPREDVATAAAEIASPRTTARTAWEAVAAREDQSMFDRVQRHLGRRSTKGRLGRSSRTPSPPRSLRPPPKIVAVSADDRHGDQPPVPLMLTKFRTLQQLRLRVADVLGCKPLGQLYIAVDAADMSSAYRGPVRSLSDLRDGDKVVATRVGGVRLRAVPFEEEQEQQQRNKEEHATEHQHR